MNPPGCCTNRFPFYIATWGDEPAPVERVPCKQNCRTSFFLEFWVALVPHREKGAWAHKTRAGTDPAHTCMNPVGFCTNSMVVRGYCFKNGSKEQNFMIESPTSAPFGA